MCVRLLVYVYICLHLTVKIYRITNLLSILLNSFCINNNNAACYSLAEFSLLTPLFYIFTLCIYVCCPVLHNFLDKF